MINDSNSNSHSNSNTTTTTTTSTTTSTTTTNDNNNNDSAPWAAGPRPAAACRRGAAPFYHYHSFISIIISIISMTIMYHFRIMIIINTSAPWGTAGPPEAACRRASFC